MTPGRAALWPAVVLALAAAALAGCNGMIPKPSPSASAGAVAAPRAASTPAPKPVAPSPPAPMIVLPTFSAQEQAALLKPGPSEPAERGFAQFVRYSRNAAIAGRDSAVPTLSAMLSDPVALDGKRRRCAAGQQPVALIDLDPAGGLFVPPANPAPSAGLALGLAVLRDAGVAIVWRSDLPVEANGPLRTALERAGLDPRGQDIVSLRRDAPDRKQARLDNLAATACIIAIAGDERPDFDERLRYLRSPDAAAGLEPLFGDGWFLIEPVFLTEGQQTQ